MTRSIDRLMATIEASRPLLWLFSIASALCGMFMAAKGVPPLPLLIIVAVGVGPCITAATNLLNAVFDIDVDKLSKPGRPLPTKRVGTRPVLVTAGALYFLGLIIAFALGTWPFVLTSFGVALSVSYSVPLARVKVRGGFSNFALALGYTTICFLGGWCIFKEIQQMSWLILGYVTLQVSGSNTVKDFVDYEGDRELKIGTLPVKYGVEKTNVLILSVFAITYLTIPLLYAIGSLSWTYLPISMLFIWGIYLTDSIKRDFSRKNRERAFLHAFFMSLVTEAAFTSAYILS